MAAATLISWANSFGDRRRAAKASSGTSIVTVAILLLLFLGNLAQSSRHQMDQRQASFPDYTCFRPAQTVRCSCPASRERKEGAKGATQVLSRRKPRLPWGRVSTFEAARIWGRAPER